MKGSVLAISPLVSAALLASACATAPRPPAMPEWSAPENAAVVASAPYDIDDGQMRVPRKDEEKEKLWQAQGLYVGGEIITAQPLGDFDDGLTLVSPNTDLLLVPELDVGPGIGIYLSYRWRMDEIVLEGSVSEHDGDFSNPSRDLDTRLLNLDLNWRHYFWAHSPMQPYGLLGVGMSRAEIEDGATDQTLTQVEDGYLKEGININVGAGVALYTLPWVMFYGQAMYRFNRYKSAEGITDELSINGDVDGDTFLLSVGAALRIARPRH